MSASSKGKAVFLDDDAGIKENFLKVNSFLFLAVKDESRTAFFGEDVHIEVSSWNESDVVFKPRTNSSYEVHVLRAGRVMNQNKSEVNSLGHVVLKDVQEEDEGLYIITSSRNSSMVKHFTLIVRGRLPAERGGCRRFCSSSKETTPLLLAFS